ncbi:MAG TPA: hypothetical protein VK625_18085 [Flavitalea sp.]|nr:hypothetical protein [Flavitalea sp.]
MGEIGSQLLRSLGGAVAQDLIRQGITGDLRIKISDAVQPYNKAILLPVGQEITPHDGIRFFGLTQPIILFHSQHRANTLIVHEIVIMLAV